MALIDTPQFVEPGLYLLWADGTRLDLTRQAIESSVRAMLDDPSRIPPRVKAAVDYLPCEICPHRETAEICHAIMPALPFLEVVDRHMSYDPVTALFRAEGDGALRVLETTMQKALQYVSILSLTTYCEVGRKYGALFEGVDPLVSPFVIAAGVFRSLYLEARGDMGKVAETVRTMQRELLHTASCQTARLKLICRRDALANAFVVTYTTTDLIFHEIRKWLHEAGGDAADPAADAARR